MSSFCVNLTFMVISCDQVGKKKAGKEKKNEAEKTLELTASFDEVPNMWEWSSPQ